MLVDKLGVSEYLGTVVQALVSSLKEKQSMELASLLSLEFGIVEQLKVIIILKNELK
jgi:hypothetical protein